MAAESEKPSEKEVRLYEIIGEYYAAAERAETPDQQAVVNQHPDLATELNEFFSEQSRFHRATEPLRELAEESRADGDSEDVTLPAGDVAKVDIQASAGAETLFEHTPYVFPTGAKVSYFGDYELLEELARGGMGVVYKARQVSLNRPVAAEDDPGRCVRRAPRISADSATRPKRSPI